MATIKQQIDHGGSLSRAYDDQTINLQTLAVDMLIVIIMIEGMFNWSYLILMFFKAVVGKAVPPPIFAVTNPRFRSIGICSFTEVTRPCSTLFAYLTVALHSSICGSTQFCSPFFFSRSQMWRFHCLLGIFLGCHHFGKARPTAPVIVSIINHLFGEIGKEAVRVLCVGRASIVHIVGIN